MSFYDAIRVGASGAADFEVERSLRFNDDDVTYLQRTVSSTSNRKTFTISAWIKPSETDSRFFFGVTDTSGYEFFYIGINSFHRLVITDYDYPVQNIGLVTNRLFRDSLAWYHIVLAVDTTQATNTDRVKLYVNGVQETSWYNEAYPVQNVDTWVNHTTFPVYIGKLGWGGGKYHGYMAEYNFIDGLQLTPSSFGETDADTGQWNPKKYVGSYGTNGFYLNFSDNSGTTATTLGKDSSGNGNNFTPNNFSVAAGTGNDSLTDTPTNNFCTINPLDTYRSGNTLAEGNLKLTRSGSNFGNARGTFAVNSGKWYYEWKCTGQHTQVGWVNTGFDINYNGGDVAVTSNGGNGVGMYWDSRTFMYGWQNSGGNDYFPSSGSFVSYTTGDIIMVAFDVDNFKFWFGKNGSWINVLGTADPSSGTDGITPVASKNNGTYRSGMYFSPLLSCFSNGNGHVNFGQRPFSYTIPTGYKELSSANLPDPTILLPNKHFDTKLWSGNSSTQAITGLNFSPDWVWSKRRSASSSHYLSDTIRGVHKILFSELTGAEYDGTSNNDGVDSFDSNGFTLQNGTYVADYNASGSTYVGWNWNAGDTDGKTYTVTVVSDSGNKYRFDGFGTSAVTLDLAEGGTYIFDQSDSSNAGHPLRFSTTSNGTHGGGSEYTTGVTTAGTPGQSGAYTQIIVAASAPTLYYYCTNHSGMGGQANTNSTLGSSNFDGAIQSTAKVNASAGFSITAYSGNGSNAQTIGHGLGVAPDVIILKARGASQNWRVWHKSLAADGSKRLLLDSTNASEDASFLNDTAPTSTVFTLGNSDDAWNASGGTYITYLFSEVAGYSKFGSYKGNNANDGTFVFTGFSVAWLMVKRTETTRDWLIYDSTRSTFNVIDDFLEPNKSTAEQTASGNSVDFVSNGFKFRNSDGDMNGLGTYIYFAFAESPFKNARAR